jgi:hypothetical protein
MNKEMELCTQCRHFGLYDVENERYYCTGRCTFFTELRTSCDRFEPAKPEEKSPGDPA